jgi:hypothetical protein
MTQNAPHPARAARGLSLSPLRGERAQGGEACASLSPPLRGKGWGEGHKEAGA